jgi:uncharacterized protein involved in outer membrane biogenesis
VRKAAIALGVVILVLAVAVVLVPRLVSLESFRPRIVAALEEKTGRRVALSGLSLSLFPGIGVKVAGLTVSGDPRNPGDTFLSVPEGEVRLAIRPLLSGKVEVAKFLLRRPKILFRSYADGAHSATDLAARLGEPGATPSPEPAGAVSVEVRSLEIEDAELSVRIEEKDGRETRWEVSPLTFRLAGLGGSRNEFEFSTRVDGAVRGEIALAGAALREPAPGGGASPVAVRAEGTVFGQKAAMEGRISAPAEGTAAELTATFPAIAMDRIVSVFAEPPAALRDAALRGTGALTLTARGTGTSAEFSVEADLTKAGWTVSPDPEVRKPVDVPCRATVQGTWAEGRLGISRAEFLLPPLRAAATASTVPSTGEREWSVSSEVSSLAELAAIPGSGLSEVSPTGRLSFSGKGKRKRAEADEEYDVALELGDAGFRIPGERFEVRSLSGRVRVTPRAAEFSPLSGLLNGQRFSVRGDVTRGPRPAGRVDLRMAYLDVDALFPPGEEDGKKGAVKPPPKEEAKEAGEPALSARADLAIDAGKARGVEFRELRGTARYEGGTLFLDSVRAKVYGGELSVSGRAQLSGPTPDFRVKVAVKELAAEEILTRKTSLKDFVSGPVSLSADLGGGIQSFEDFARTAAGAGSVRVTGGRIKGVDLLGTAAGLAGLSSLVPAVPGAAAVRETPFSDLSADFRIDGGKIRTDALRIVSEKMGLAGSAAVGFDRTLDFRGTLRLSGELSSRARGAAGKFLLDPKGQVEIPLFLSGPLTSPAMSIDAETLARGAGERILRGVTERVIGGPKAPAADNAAPGEPAGRPEPAREVEDLLRKLLPGK